MSLNLAEGRIGPWTVTQPPESGTTDRDYETEWAALKIGIDARVRLVDITARSGGGFAGNS